MTYILWKQKDLKYGFRETSGYLSGSRAKVPKRALEGLREVIRTDNYTREEETNGPNGTCAFSRSWLKPKNDS